MSLIELMVKPRSTQFSKSRVDLQNIKSQLQQTNLLSPKMFKHKIHNSSADKNMLKYHKYIELTYKLSLLKTADAFVCENLEFFCHRFMVAFLLESNHFDVDLTLMFC